MLKHHITKQYTPMAFMLPVVFVFALAFASSGAVASIGFGSAICAALALLGAAVWQFDNYLRIRRRPEQLRKVAAKYGYSMDGVSNLGSIGALDEVHGARDPQLQNTINAADWTYADFMYQLYGKTKYGEYVRTKVYYGVMSTVLSRSLPNVFFDSKKARGRQFRFHFAQNQKHSLEGDFDAFFVTYFPQQYTIDSMSFITPEVMWQMRAAADYDIEIVGDRLFLYGPLSDPEKQIADMSRKILAIKKALLNNIVTYRDERLPYADGRKRVAPLGVALAYSKFWRIFGICTTVAWIVFYIWSELQK